MYSIRWLLRLAGLLTLLIWHAESSKAQTRLQAYIEEGLANNLVMKQKNIGIGMSLLALKAARSYYLPMAGFTGEYTLAKGGRTFDIPIGDLLNPVYATLNQLTASQNFSQVENAAIQLLPDNFYDARVRVSWSLLNTDRHYNYAIKKEETRMAEFDVETYKQELTRDIETAYYNYCLAVDATGIFESALGLVDRNLRVNESLVRNGKGLPANVLRAESEAEQIRSRMGEAGNQRRNAQSWFNFLLNRPMTDTIIYDSLPLPADLAEAVSARPVTENRSELKQLAAAWSARQSVISMNRSYAVPRINTFVDLGLQNFDWQFDQKSSYLLAGFQVTMPVFEGFRNRVKISESLLASEDLQLTRENTSRQIAVAASVAQNNLSTALVNLGSTEKQFRAARAYFVLIEKGYAEGINSLIEFMDARNQLTASEIQVRLNRYRVLSAYSDLKRQTAASTIQ